MFPNPSRTTTTIRLTLIYPGFHATSKKFLWLPRFTTLTIASKISAWFAARSWKFLGRAEKLRRSRSKIFQWRRRLFSVKFIVTRARGNSMRRARVSAEGLPRCVIISVSKLKTFNRRHRRPNPNAQRLILGVKKLKFRRHPNLAKNRLNLKKLNFARVRRSASLRKAQRSAKSS